MAVDGQPIGRRIATKRKTHGWSQEALAKHLKVSQGQVSDWETGRVPQQERHMRKLARFLEEDPNDVVAEFRAIRFSDPITDELAALRAELAELRSQLQALRDQLPPA